MKWKKEVISLLENELQKDEIWKDIFIESQKRNNSIHLAVFAEPFLSLILNGKKTIESRFSKNNISPFNKINRGDLVVLKKSGGNITGVFQSGKILNQRNLNSNLLNDLESKYGEKICSGIDPDFWKDRKDKNYATLIWVNKFKSISPFRINKKDRRGWVVLNEKKESILF